MRRFVTRVMGAVRMWGRRDSPPAPPPEPPRAVTPGLIEARAAREQAATDLLGAIHRGPETREVVERVHAHGRRNGWSELWDATIHGRERP